MSLRVEPITFAPLYMERVWGGRELERTYGRHLPHPDRPYGESWEIVDREAEQSIVEDGPFAGKSLHHLWENHRPELFGDDLPPSERFPILIKILDARDDLSIQVHPPAGLAPSLGGEPKTEMWYIAGCDPGAKLYVGLKKGVTRETFEASIADGTVAGVVHSISPRPGDSIFIASGRLHAIGAGFLIHEIQQNSDTTYRVFDWNRLGLDGKPRELHLGPSLASIDFDDFEPGMDTPSGETLASCPYFKTEKIEPAADSDIRTPADRFAILSVIEGTLKTSDGRTFSKGRVILLPRGCPPLTAGENSALLRVTLPSNRSPGFSQP